MYLYIIYVCTYNFSHNIYMYFYICIFQCLYCTRTPIFLSSLKKYQGQKNINIHLSRWVWVVKSLPNINLQIPTWSCGQKCTQVPGTGLPLWEKRCFIPCWWLIFQAHFADSFYQHSVVSAELFIPQYFYRLWGWKMFSSRQDIWTP